MCCRYLYGHASNGSTPGSPARDVFVAGVSGYAYLYPDDLGTAAELAESAAITAAYMKKADMRIGAAARGFRSGARRAFHAPRWTRFAVNVLVNGHGIAPATATAMLLSPSVDAMFLYNYDDYSGGRAARAPRMHACGRA